MKKVGIMTLHIGDNYGALLQCYALRKVINNMPDMHADIINFDPGRIFPVYEDDEVQVNYEKKLAKFEQFHLVENGIAQERFTSFKDVDCLDYDYYITGSDQVWNTSFVFTNKAYFLDFVPDEAKRIAYAPSIGIPADSPKLKKEWFKEYIPQFDYLSLREMSHEKYLQQFTDKKIHSVVDPTLLLQHKDYDELCEGVQYPSGEYLVLYFLKHDNSAPLLFEFANMISRKYNLKIIYSSAKAPTNIFKNQSETFYYSDPKEFVQLIKHAKVVVTNSFHGTVFSLIHHVPFFTYIVKSMSSRVIDLLHSVGLEDRIVYGYRRLSDEMLDVDFTKADEILKIRREESLKYLKTALEVEKL